MGDGEHDISGLTRREKLLAKGAHILGRFVMSALSFIRMRWL